MQFDSYSTPDAEALLHSAAARRTTTDPGRRIAVTEGAVAVAFLAVALVLALGVHATTPLAAAPLAITIVLFIAAQWVLFPVGSAWQTATQVVFVPMLFLLPMSLVPLVVLIAKLLYVSPRWVRGTASTPRVLAQFGDSVYTLGPVLVLIAAHAETFAWTHWPVYVAAFAAQVILDIASGLGRTWFAERILPSQQVQMAWLYLTDAALSCCGLLVAASAVGHPELMLLTLPLIGLLGLFARERQERIDNTLALSTAYRGTALLLGDVIEDDDEYTGVHSREVVDLAAAVAERLRLDASARRDVEFGALLHDVGKIRIPKEIIQKPGNLDEAEWAVMRQHTVYGEQMLRQVGGTLSNVGKVVRHSHEHYDGTGYPDGLAGEAIPIESRIVCACDAFNAMTTNRPYRLAMSGPEAVAELRRSSGTHFDPRVVEALLGVLAARPTGMPAGEAGTSSRSPLVF